MKTLEFNSIVEASLTEVWNAWTTNEGVRGFFAPDSNVELRIGGDYELFFEPTAAPGFRGTEGMKVQSFVPERFLAFDWKPASSFPVVREEKTWVVLEFAELDDELCEVTLTHLGWGEGPDWEAAQSYFSVAWQTVLSRFERAMRMGAMDWENQTAAQR